MHYPNFAYRNDFRIHCMQRKHLFSKIIYYRNQSDHQCTVTTGHLLEIAQLCHTQPLFILALLLGNFNCNHLSTGDS